MNYIYQNGMMPTVYKTSIAKSTGHIITTSFVENTFKTTIVKPDVSDHIPNSEAAIQRCS